jgi:hypothetical protein
MPNPQSLYLIPYTLYLIPYTLYPITFWKGRSEEWKDGKGGKMCFLLPYTLYPIPYTLSLTPNPQSLTYWIISLFALLMSLPFILSTYIPFAKYGNGTCNI